MSEPKKRYIIQVSEVSEDGATVTPILEEMSEKSCDGFAVLMLRDENDEDLSHAEMIYKLSLYDIAFMLHHNARLKQAAELARLLDMFEKEKKGEEKDAAD